MYLILSGMVRVLRKLPGGETAANNLESGGYFGEQAILDEATPSNSGTESDASVQTLCKSYLLRLEPSVLRRWQNRGESTGNSSTSCGASGRGWKRAMKCSTRAICCRPWCRRRQLPTNSS